MKQTIKISLYATAATVVMSVACLPGFSDSFDMSSELRYANGAPDYNREPLTENAGSMVAATPYGPDTPTQGDMGDSPDALNPLNRKRHDSERTGEYFGRPYVAGQLRNRTQKQTVPSREATTRLIAPLTVNQAPFPSGSWTLGFPSQPARSYVGVGPSTTQGRPGGSLPPTTTGSVDINIVER